MSRISFITSLMEFQKRVLTQGSVNDKRKYTIEQLKDLLFFNKVFISNTTEMFQKHNMIDKTNDYQECLIQYNANVYKLISKMEELLNIKVYGDDMSSFEKRMFVDKALSDALIYQKYKSIEKAASHKFKSEVLYYIIFDRGNILIATIDPKQMVYETIIETDVDNQKIYWRTGEAILEYLAIKHNSPYVLMVKVTKGPKKKTGKVEYHGNKKVIDLIQSKMFLDQPVLFNNPNLFIDDIEKLINKYIEVKPEIESGYRYVSIDKLFNSDLLIEYPNDSFDIYLDFLSTVSKYDDTKAIYLTLYRIGSDPSIYYILRDAVEFGIHVEVNLEMHATGEEINKTWLRELRAAGIKVNTYACGELKVHSKLTLVEFKSSRMIAQVGTGNYHTKTASQYTDFSYITASKSICTNVKKVFTILGSEYRNEPELSFDDSFLVTQYNAKQELIRLVDNEGKKGKNGCIVIKCNSLDDEEIIQHLEAAGNKKCNIVLIIRSVCTWLPDMPNVKIKSILWDKLEHSRVYSFGSHNPIVYIGSLDLVTKKIEKRIETLVRIDNPKIHVQVCEYLSRYTSSTMGSWAQSSTGAYIKE